MMRQIVLDTETTGIDISSGNRVIEIGCIEVINRKITGNHYHQYINPQREIEEGAFKVHGLSTEFLSGYPLFSAIVDEFVEFIAGAELIIHNAPFDVGFLNHEFSLLKGGHKDIDHICQVVDTLYLAKNKHPGQRNSLDALCKRYDIDNSNRSLHGALLDSELLAEVYLRMTGGQTGLLLEVEQVNSFSSNLSDTNDTSSLNFKIQKANEIEQKRHEEYLDFLNQSSDSGHFF